MKNMNKSEYWIHSKDGKIKKIGSVGRLFTTIGGG